MQMYTVNVNQIQKKLSRFLRVLTQIRHPTEMAAPCGTWVPKQLAGGGRSYRRRIERTVRRSVGVVGLAVVAPRS